MAMRITDIGDDELAALPRDTKILNIWLRDCEKLRAGDHFGSSDPYVVLQLSGPPEAIPDGPQLQTSSCIAGSTEPAWRPFERFLFKVHDPLKTRLVVTVRDRDPLKKDSDLGDCVLPLKALAADEGGDGEVQLDKHLPLIDPRTGQADPAGAFVRINWQLADKIKATMYHQDFIYQYQILVKGRGWGASEAHLGTRDNPKHVGFHGHEFSTLDAVRTGGSLEAVAGPVPAGHAVTQTWNITTNDGNAEGWMYARTPTGPKWFDHEATNAFVRRRTWCRVSERTGAHEAQAELQRQSQHLRESAGAPAPAAGGADGGGGDGDGEEPSISPMAIDVADAGGAV